MTRILVIDNYDSFVYTIAGYLQQLGAEVEVVRNDTWSSGELESRLAELDGVLVSPGPGTPAAAGVSVAAVHLAIRHELPLLGVCLGHQAIAEALGATVTHAEELRHGKISRVHHFGDELFAGVDPDFDATRYHSLAVVRETVPASLEITAETQGGVIMALRHREAPVFGVQYHPESVLTEGGYQQLGNWLRLAGVANAAEIAATLRPMVSRGASDAD